MQFYGINICQSMISKFYTVYKKHEMIKIYNQTREKSQELSHYLFASWIILSESYNKTYIIF